MNIQTIKTDKITPNTLSVTDLIEQYISKFEDNSILVITSKVVSICEGSLAKKTTQSKNDLAAEEADFYLPPSQSKYDVTLTIKNNQLIPSAGIDESNSDGHFIFWPKDPQQTANNCREFLAKKFNLTHVGVIFSDSKTTPLRWGTTGTSIAHSGFLAINDFIGKPDIFGRPLAMTKVNVVDALACAAVLQMGESNEQTPLAIISDIPFVQFQNRNPTQEEIESLHIDLEDDIYAPLLNSNKWIKKISEN
jgi:putative folate metabolism gamma-glutamate ligase